MMVKHKDRVKEVTTYVGEVASGTLAEIELKAVDEACRKTPRQLNVNPFSAKLPVAQVDCSAKRYQRYEHL